MRRHHELPFGAELNADGVRFRLWAPRAQEVALLLEDPQYSAVPMVAEADGWFSLTSGEARALWHDYLGRRLRRNLPWTRAAPRGA